MKFIANRMECIDASGIRKVFALAARMDNPINLSIGQPDYDVEAAVKETAIAAIRGGFNRYTQTGGIEPLREAVCAYYQRRFGVALENVMITCGVAGGLTLVLMATVNPGDEVLCADPYFVVYKHLVNVLGGVCKPIDTYPDFQLNAEAVEAAISEKTKILLLNSPSNPTGITLAKTELAALAAVAKKHGLLVITDEIYEQLQYDGEPATIAGMYENVVLLNGFSKMAGMPGWRVGFAAGPADILQEMNTLQQYTFVCAPSFAQKACVPALKQDPAPKIAAYRKKRDIVYDGIKDHFRVVRPTGAFYIFPEAPGGDGGRFVARAVEHNVLIIPGSVFSERKTHFRISFAVDNAVLERGVEILNQLADEFS